MNKNFERLVYLKLRLLMSVIFLWAFFDKLLGLGFATSSENAWIAGGSPTYGFLTFGTKGPLADFFQSMAGSPLLDWTFMIGLLFIGLTLLFNRFVVWGAVAGSLMMFLMYIAAFPPENNPLVDDHVIYILVLALIAYRSEARKSS